MLTQEEFEKKYVNTVQCADCLELMKDWADSVLIKGLTAHTKTSKIVTHEESRQIQESGSGEAVASSQDRDKMAVLRADVVDSQNSDVLQHLADGHGQGNGSAGDSISGPGASGQAQRELQGRLSKRSVSPDDRERLLREVRSNREAGDSSRKRESSGQSPAESASSLRELPQPLSQDDVVGNPQVVCITDPPYGVSFRGEEWDAEIPEIASYLPSLFDICMIITAPTTMWDYPRPDWVLCWTRPGSCSRTKSGTFNHWTPILLYGDKGPNPDLLKLPGYGYPNGGIGHPSPKPLALMEWLIASVSPEHVILDPFCGSGTTCVAAKKLGRNYIGIDISEEYCQIARERLEAVDTGVPVKEARRGQMGLFQ